MKITAIPAFLQALESENSPEKIESQLPLMLETIKNLLAEIKAVDNIQEANFYFDNLQKIQETLSTLVFIKQVAINKELGKFLSDCERLDVAWTREFLFKRLKADTYHLETGISLFHERVD